MHPELHVWKCRCVWLYDEFLIVSVICETVLPYHIIQRDDIGNFILAVLCVIIVSRHPSLVLDGKCSSVSLEADPLVRLLDFGSQLLVAN